METGYCSVRSYRTWRIKKYNILIVIIFMLEESLTNNCCVSGWSALLSRKNLLRASRHLAEICGQCSLVFPSQAPTLVSACLVSLEPDSHFRMMPDQVTPDERFGQQSANSHLSTPEDASCTHILVFPTSATTRVRSYCGLAGLCKS